ncbi:MAG: autotransporter outer membrane beta-barrel domain-containing protein [Hyphomicrobiales bacterium]
MGQLGIISRYLTKTGKRVTKIALTIPLTAGILSGAFLVHANTAHAGGANGGTCASFPETNSSFTNFVFVDGDTITISQPQGSTANRLQVTQGTGSIQLPFSGSWVAGTDFYSGTVTLLGIDTNSNNQVENVHISCTPAGSSGHSVQAAGTLIAQRHTTEVVTGAVNSEVTAALLGSGGSGGAGLAFTQNSASISLEQLMAMNANRKKTRPNAVLAYGEDGQRYDPSMPLKPLPYNVWGHINYGNYNGGDAALDGSVTNFLVGFDRRFGADALLGVIAGYEISDFDFDSVDSKLEGEGPTLGIYAGIKLTPQLVADISITHSWVSYDSSIAGVTADYDASRWSIGGNLTGSFEWNSFTIQPTAKAFISFEDQDAYVDSSSASFASRDVTIGRVSLGPKIFYPHVFEAGRSAKFWALAKAEYDFSSEDSTTSSLLTSNDVFSARIGAGVDAEITDNASVGLSIEGHGLGGGEYIGIDVSGRARLQF